MGQSKGNGYTQLPTGTQGQISGIEQLLQLFGPNQQAASEGFKQFLPNGGGGQAITEQANKNFQQQTIPSILNSFGGANKGSSALNQALAAGASNLNTDLASMLSKLQLEAAQGAGNLGTNQAQLGINSPTFAYQPKQTPLWQSLVEGLLPAAGKIFGSNT